MKAVKKLPVLITAITIITFFTSCQKTSQDEPTKIAKCTHSVGLCNFPIFIAKEENTTKEYNVKIDLINIPNWGDHPAALTSGTVDFSVTPFTNVISAYANGAPIKIISGSGMNGLFLVSSNSIKTIEELKNKKIGTFRADTLEMVLYSFLKKNNLSYKDVEISYFTDGFELIHAFANGKIDAMTHVEPYATQARRKYNANILADGQTVWGGNHPDCVLTASDKVIKERPEVVKAMIFGMMKAENLIEKELEKSIDKVVGKYYKTDRIDIINAAKSQPPGIDIRDNKNFILSRFKDLKELGYIKSNPDPNIFDFRFLNEVIHDHPELHKSLKVKATLP